MIKKLVNYMYAYSHLTLHLIKSVNRTIVQLSQWTVLFYEGKTRKKNYFFIIFNKLQKAVRNSPVPILPLRSLLTVFSLSLIFLLLCFYPLR